MIESDKVEFKQEWKDDFLRVVCAFANSDGGILYIGKDDKGNDIGVDNNRELLETLPNKINSKLGIIPDVDSVECNNKNIIAIIIKKASTPVSFNGKFYFRSGSVVIELQGKKLSDFLLHKSGNTWDGISLDNINIGQINKQTIEIFKRYAIDRLPSINLEKSSRSILNKLNLLESNKYKRAAILLFGKNTQKIFPQAHIRIGRFVSESEIVSSDIIEGNLFEQLENTLEILRKKYLISLFKFEGVHRREKSFYPIEALREALLNAIIHRDYNSNSAIQVRIYDNKLMILNEGSLPEGLSIDSLKKTHLSIPRNILLANVFYKAGFIESWGSGTLKIIEYCKKSGVKEVLFNDENNFFSITFIENVPENGPENVPENVPENRLGIILYNLKQKPETTIDELCKILKVTNKTVKRDLEKLKRENKIKRIGPDKGGYWKIIVD